MNIEDQEIADIIELLEDAKVAEMTIVTEDGGVGSKIIHEDKELGIEKLFMLLGATNATQDYIKENLPEPDVERNILEEQRGKEGHNIEVK